VRLAHGATTYRVEIPTFHNFTAAWHLLDVAAGQILRGVKRGPCFHAEPLPLSLEGETWRPVPRRPAYEVSDKHRVRTYWKSGRVPLQLAAEPQRVLRPRPSTRSRYPRVQLKDGKGGHESFSVASLVQSAFEPPTRKPLSRLGPWLAPPDARWRVVPGWNAYDVSRCGLVRSYFIPGGWISKLPYRLLRPLWDPTLEQMVVTLCDRRGDQRKFPIARLIWLAWHAPEADSA
jgi:hypothetical protein